MAIPDKVEWDDETGSWVAATGRPGAENAYWDGSQWVRGKNPEGPGALRRGFATGIESTKGLVADVIPAMVQQALGYEAAAKKNLEEYKKRMDDLKAKNLLAISDINSIKDVSSFLSFAGEAVGQAIPSLATSVLGGVGAASGAARLGAGRILSNQVAKRAAELEGKGLATEKALEVATKEASQRVGGAVGAFGGSALLNIPESYASLAEAGDANLGAAFAVGTLKSSLDALGPIRLLSKARGPEFSDKLTDLISARLLKNRPGTAGLVGGSLETFALEGLTEGTQELLDQTAASILADKTIDWDQILTASLRGGIGAAPVGGAVGAYSRRRQEAATQQEAAEKQAAEEAQKQKAAEEESYQTYAGQRFTGEYQPPSPAKTDLDFLKEAASEVRNKYDSIPIEIGEDGKVNVKPQDTIKLAQQMKAAGNTTPLSKLIKDLQAGIESDVKSTAADLKSGEPYQKFVEGQEAAAGIKPKPAIFRRLEEANKLVTQIQNDPEMLEAPGVREQYEEAKTLIRDAEEKAAAEKKLAEEGIPEVGAFGVAPSRKGTPAEIEAVEKTTAYEEPAEEKAAPISLTTSEKKEVEDLIRELPRGQTLSIASVQQRLSDLGKPVSLDEARSILQTYIPRKFPIGKALPEGAVLGVPESLQLREKDGQFVKTGVVEEAFRKEAPTLTSERGGARAFPEVTPTTETTSPITKIQGLLQNIPLGLSQETWAGIANKISRMDPRKILSLKDLEAAAGPGVKLSSKEAPDLWESLVNAGIVSKAGGLGYRVKADAPTASQYIDEVVGSTTTVAPKAIEGAGMVPHTTRKQLYALGYNREDVAAMTPKEAQSILANKEKKSILKAEKGVSRRGFLGGLLASAVAFVSGAKATTPASKELVFHLRNNDVPASLKHISENSSNPVFRKLAAMLLQGGMGRMQMRVVSATPSGIRDAIRFGYGDADTLQTALKSPGFLGYVDIDNVDNPTLIIFDRETGATGLSEEVFLHEAVHGWVMSRWRALNTYPSKSNAEKLGYQRNPKDTETIYELLGLYKNFKMAVEKQFGANSPELRQAALRDFDEFLAYGLTSPEFRDLLSSFDYRPNAYNPITPVGKGVPSFFDKIYSYILKLFKITPTQFRTLDEFQRITDKLLSTSAPPDFDVASRFSQAKRPKQDTILRSEKENVVKGIVDAVSQTSRRGFLRGVGSAAMSAGLPGTQAIKQATDATRKIQDLNTTIRKLDDIFRSGDMGGLWKIPEPLQEPSAAISRGDTYLYAYKNDSDNTWANDTLQDQKKIQAVQGNLKDLEVNFSTFHPRVRRIPEVKNAENSLAELEKKYEIAFEQFNDDLSEKAGDLNSQLPYLDLADTPLRKKMSGHHLDTLKILFDFTGLNVDRGLNLPVNTFADYNFLHTGFSDTFNLFVGKQNLALAEAAARRAGLDKKYDWSASTPEGILNRVREVLPTIEDPKLRNEAARFVREATEFQNLTSDDMRELEATISKVAKEYVAALPKAMSELQKFARLHKFTTKVLPEIASGVNKVQKIYEKYEARDLLERRKDAKQRAEESRGAAPTTPRATTLTNTVFREIAIPRGTPAQMQKRLDSMFGRMQRLQEAADDAIPDDYSCG